MRANIRIRLGRNFNIHENIEIFYINDGPEERKTTKEWFDQGCKYEISFREKWVNKYNLSYPGPQVSDDVGVHTISKVMLLFLRKAPSYREGRGLQLF
jgi:hypothetical protein